MTISWTKYIPVDEKETYEKLGWDVSEKLKETHHGRWSYLGVWRGAGEPPMPETANAG